MPPKATSLCSCGEKLKTGTALSDHLKDSPKHKNPPIKGNAVPKPADLKAKTVAMKTNPENSALVKNTPTSNVVSTHPTTMNSFRTIADWDT